MMYRQEYVVVVVTEGDGLHSEVVARLLEVPGVFSVRVGSVSPGDGEYLIKGGEDE